MKSKLCSYSPVDGVYEHHSGNSYEIFTCGRDDCLYLIHTLVSFKEGEMTLQEAMNCILYTYNFENKEKQ